MSNFKVVFPTGYSILNIYDDNIDLNVILPDGVVLFATFFTVLNIQKLIKNTGTLYFWSTSMVIVKDLKKDTIKEVVSTIIQDEYLEISFSKIGTIKDVYPGKKFYDEIIDNI